MSEWLGTGLQNRLHQFESGWNLQKSQTARCDSFLFSDYVKIVFYSQG